MRHCEPKVIRDCEPTEPQPMLYKLIPAAPGDERWLEQLRRSVYQELFFATGSAGIATHVMTAGDLTHRLERSRPVTEVSASADPSG